MKKILLFFILALPLVSCKKEADIPNVAGEWDVTFTTEASAYNHGAFSINQDGNNLTGTFTLSGNVIPLLSNSAVTSVIAIYCDIYLFAGTLTDSDSMSGDLYIFDYFAGQYNKSGTWDAVRK